MNEKELNKSIYPWILNGLSFVLSVIAYIIFVFQIIPSDLFWTFSNSWFYVMIFYFLLASTLGIIGLVISIKKLKTSRRLTNVLAIIISTIVIVLAILLGIIVELSIFARTT